MSMKGDFPSSENEIAIDRMYADNNHLSVGDTLKSDSHEWTITGLVALPDYSCLFQNNNDSMFDSVKFGVAVVTPEAFSKFESSSIKYVYSWKYAKEPANDKEEKKVSDDLMKAINKEVSLQDYVPRYLNQAINFTGDDMGSDRAMIIVFLYIIIVIMAFVFGITSSNTIMKESNVIGTLLASGYTRAELIRHYMSMPIIVTLIGAVIGNILGYTVLKDVCAGMYYGSYSLPTYTTIWNAEAFLLTTVIPIILMILVNFTILYRKLSLSPLKFLSMFPSYLQTNSPLAILNSPEAGIFQPFPHACYFSEYQQLCTVICRNPFCKSPFNVRTAFPCSTRSLSGSPLR